MPPQIESFHGYALATSHKSGVFYSDVRRDAEDYGINKDTVAAVANNFLDRRCP